MHEALLSKENAFAKSLSKAPYAPLLSRHFFHFSVIVSAVQKTGSKNINCLKINLSKILEILDKMLTGLWFSLSILDFFLRTGLTPALLKCQETLQ